jgi:hypothetical protein
MSGNHPKDRIRHLEHGESLKSGTTLFAGNLNITIIRESMSVPSEAISVMHLEEEVTLLLAVPNLETWEPNLPKTEETLKIYATG